VRGGSGEVTKSPKVGGLLRGKRGGWEEKTAYGARPSFREKKEESLFVGGNGNNRGKKKREKGKEPQRGENREDAT